MQETNTQLNPGTLPNNLPNKVVFDASLQQQSIGQIPDKKQIITNTVGGRRFSPKIILIFLGIFLLILVLAVIAKVASNTNQNKEVKLTWWSLKEDEDAVKPLIDEYKQKNPKVTIEFVKQSSQDYRERLTNSFIKGQGPDIFEFHNTWLPMLFNYFSFNSFDLSSTFYPVVTDDLKTKNGFAGVPLEYDGITLFINQDIFRAYGKDYPKTWDEFRRDAKDLTVRDENGVIRQAGAALGTTSNVDYWQDVLGLLLLQNGSDLKNFESPSSSAALTFYTNFSKTDHVWDDALPNSTTFFGQGKLAMYFGKYSDAIAFSKNPSVHFQVVPLPQLPATPNNSSIAYASYWVEGVNKNSANVNAAWEFLNFISSKDSLTKLHTGIYPRRDMQNELLSNQLAGPFAYQAGFARSWYLADKTFDGPTGINSQLAKPFADAFSLVGGNSSLEQVIGGLQSQITEVLANYGIVSAPLPKKQ